MERPEIREFSSDFVFVNRDSLEELQEYVDFLEEENTLKDYRINFLKKTVTRIVDKYLSAIKVLNMVDPEVEYYSPTKEELIEDVTKMTMTESYRLSGSEWLKRGWDNE